MWFGFAQNTIGVFTLVKLNFDFGILVGAVADCEPINTESCEEYSLSLIGRNVKRKTADNGMWCEWVCQYVYNAQRGL